MKLTSIFWIFILGCVWSGYGQKASKADRFFYEYNYRLAIDAYQEAQRENPLSPQQRLNLAEALFKTRQYERASDLYVELFKGDSLIGNHHFNRMLQALAKTSGKDRARAFLNTRQDVLADELLENAQFNFELFENPPDAAPYTITGLSTNSPQADFSPAYYGEDRLLFTSSRPQEHKDTYGPTGESYMDIFVAVRDTDGQTRSPQVLTWLPQLKYHEATPFYSESLNGIFYVRSNAEDGEMTFDENGKNALVVGLATRDGGFQLLLRDPSTSFYYPFYDGENQRLYFAADFEQGFGGTDLYYVETNKGRIMSAPVNLGPRINTPGNEISPYLLEGSLYFASDVFFGLGGMDLYKADFRQEGGFSIPVNLGPDINTAQDEFGMILHRTPDGQYAGYFSSNRPGGVGQDDIYAFSIDEKPGMKTRVFQGEVVSLDGIGLEKAAVRILNGEGQEVKTTYTREDGSFYLELPWVEQLRLEIDKERYTREDLDFEATAEATASGSPIRAVLTAVEDVVRQRDGRRLLEAERFHFERGRTDITPEIQAALAPVAEALKMFPQMRIRIEAHTDSRGSEQTNLRLSEQRANAIKSYLVSQGVDPDSIAELEGFGERQIINNCTDGVYCLEVLHKQNERYPMVVLNYESL